MTSARISNMEEAECESVTSTSSNKAVAGWHAIHERGRRRLWGKRWRRVAPRVDYTRIPSELDAKLRQLDTDGEMRPTKIKVGRQWSALAEGAARGAEAGAPL